MNLFKLCYHGCKELEANCFTERFPAMHNVVLQRFTFNVVHNDIACFVLIENVPDLDYMGKITKLDRLASFFDKTFATLLQFIGISASAPKYQTALGGAAHGGSGREILFDTHWHFQREVPDNIGDSKTTLTEDFSNKISASQYCTTSQCVAWLHFGTFCIVKTAIRAYLTREIQFFHAGIATRKLHDGTSLFRKSTNIKAQFLKGTLV